MTRPGDKTFWNSDEAAVAPTFVIASFALVAVMGISFDYARLAVLDSEMQAAADQAALAAATQLDGLSGARTRADTAADSLVQNKTILANDGGARALTVASKTYYDSYTSNTTGDAYGTVSTTDSGAKYVRIVLTARKAFYALTPIIRLFNSGNLTAEAVAGVKSSICKVPPLMICGPHGIDYPTDADIGKGLVMKVGPGNSWGPGMFGYLDFGNGAQTVKQLLGSNNGLDYCQSGSGVSPQHGNINGALDYLNTRFDVYPNGNAAPQPADCNAAGDNCPAESVRKDLLRMEQYFYKNPGTPPTTQPACNSALVSDPNGKPVVTVTEWVELPAGTLPTSGAVQGLQRDTCSYNGTCVDPETGASGSNFGDGTWDVAGYRLAHPNVPNNLTTRYSIYKWERDNKATGLQPTLVNNDASAIVKSGCNSQGKNCDYTVTNYCSYPQAIKGTYHATAKDRRLITVAVVDCGSAASPQSPPFTIKKWADFFLTEPSWNRTTAGKTTSSSEIYAEVVGVATKPDGSNSFQYYGRNEVVLIR